MNKIFFEYFYNMKPSEEYIYKQPQKYQDIMLCVWDTIRNNIPDTELLYKWGIPYVYYKKKPFVYLAPNHKKGFVDVGFAKGFQLTQNLDKLIDENRNTVKSLRYFSLEEIENDVLIAVLEEASRLYP